MKVMQTDLDLPILPAQSERSEGLHVSDLYNSLYAELEPERFAKGDGPDELKMAVGVAWEAYLEARLLEAGIAAKRPPEQVTKEGIAYSPDLLIGDDCVGEIKVTWMSDRDITDKRFAKWLTQLKTYCYHQRRRKGRIYALFLNGNYRGNRNPVLRQYDLEFTKAELADCWKMLQNFGRHRKLL